MDASQEHTRWNCRYHIVRASTFRRKIIYGKYRKEIGAILRKLCDYKGIEIVEANACVDHIAKTIGTKLRLQVGDQRFRFSRSSSWASFTYLSPSLTR